MTSGGGLWSFSGLDASYPGKHVYEVLPSGYVQTLGALGYTITGTSGADQTNLNFANFKLFEISGHKYTDVTGNGVSADDTGLDGVTIFIDANGNGQLDGSEKSTVTHDGGQWSFTGLDYTYAGDTVYEQVPDGYVQTVGADGYAITGTSGTNQDNLDFANGLPDWALSKDVAVGDATYHATNTVFESNGIIPSDPADENVDDVVDHAGQLLHYTVTLVNDGNIPIAQIAATDSLAGALSVPAGNDENVDPDVFVHTFNGLDGVAGTSDDITLTVTHGLGYTGTLGDNILDPLETWTWTYDYAATPADIANFGNGVDPGVIRNDVDVQTSDQIVADKLKNPLRRLHDGQGVASGLGAVQGCRGRR